MKNIEKHIKQDIKLYYQIKKKNCRLLNTKSPRILNQGPFQIIQYEIYSSFYQNVLEHGKRFFDIWSTVVVEGCLKGASVLN